MSVRRQAGFSIFEVMVVVVIVAIIAAMAAPGFQTLQRKVRIYTLSEEVMNSLSLARTTAVTKHRDVYWIRTGDGWEVRQDNATTGTILSTYVISQPNLVLTMTPDLTDPDTLKFESTGLIKRNDTSALVEMTFMVCSSDVDTEAGRNVRLNRLGRMFPEAHTSSATCNP
jgi:type II secretion system protein H